VTGNTDAAYEWDVLVSAWHFHRPLLNKQFNVLEKLIEPKTFENVALQKKKFAKVIHSVISSLVKPYHIICSFLYLVDDDSQCERHQRQVKQWIVCGADSVHY
jgi:hypothetical protein